MDAVGGNPVIGTKKLGIIRQELRGALNTTGEDPIRWLEERMTAPDGTAKTEVVGGLRRFLEGTAREKSRKQRVGKKN
jgi:hypothetical protein